MREEQMVHISMINSYNVLLGNATVQDVINSGIGVFCHSIDESDAMNSIVFMVHYFEDLEMYERCAKLNKYISKTFNKDGSYKKAMCECPNPEIDRYIHPVKCSLCSLTIKM